MLNYINFLYVELALSSCDEPHLVVMYFHFYMLLDSIC